MGCSDGLQWSKTGNDSNGLTAKMQTLVRVACGYALTNREHDTRALQAYLGHRNIQHGALYGAIADAV
jgi:hypothetical protein